MEVPVTDQMRRMRKKRMELKIHSPIFNHLLRVCNVPDTVPRARYLAPLGAANAQATALGSWRWVSMGRNSSGKLLSSVENPETCGMSRAGVQEALGYEVWVQENDDLIRDQVRKALARGG